MSARKKAKIHSQKHPECDSVSSKTGCQWRMIPKDFAAWVLDKYGWELEVVLRPNECPSKFKVIPKRWIVERTFAWLENFRRLTIHYEFHANTAESMVQHAFMDTTSYQDSQEEHGEPYLNIERQEGK